MRKLGIFTAAFGLAAAAFWSTMLTDPPKTEAAIAAPPPCIAAARLLAPWFQGQASRERAARPERGIDQNLLLTWFRSAQQQCGAGASERALANLRALETMIAAIEKRRAARGI